MLILRRIDANLGGQARDGKAVEVCFQGRWGLMQTQGRLELRVVLKEDKVANQR